MSQGIASRSTFSMVLELKPAISQGQVQPPCQAACPAGVRARDYIALIAQCRYRDAISLIREQMPFPSACGRICYYPCEAECNRGLVDEPVAIMHLKRFVSDYAYQAKFPYPDPVPKKRVETIAIIGAGPCGLTAAQDLTRLGYSVTIFEALPFPGGTLRAALPFYSLPKKLLDWDIENILALGMELKTKVTLDKSFSLEELREEGYRAILIATGADRSRKLSQPEVGIFAEGDLAAGTLWTVHAVAAGHQAATAIARYLQNGSVIPFTVNPTRVAKLAKVDLEERIRQGQIKLKPRAEMPLWEPLEKVTDFSEMYLGYDEETAWQEARRCLNCGAVEIVDDECTACLTCVRICPYEVPIMSQGTVEIRVERCRACGICVGECPAEAIVSTLPGINDISSQIEAILKERPRSELEPLIIGLCCSYWAQTIVSCSASIGADFPNVEIIPLLCLTKVDVTHLLKAFELGADGIFIIGCKEEDCPYQKSTLWAKQNVENARRILGGVGLEGERIEMYNLSASDISRFNETIAEFKQRIRQLRANSTKSGSHT